MSDHVKGPLSGISVLEFSQVIAAPFGGQFLAEMGAEVTKVEPPTGDSWRHQLSFAPGESRSFQGLNRGKRDITLALDSPEAQAIVHKIVRKSDVVLINYRPDVPARMQIDYETLRQINPAVVYADLTAFGRRGPWAMRPGYDGVVQAVTGLMAGEGKLRPDGAPGTIASTAVADYCSGMVLADAILAALYHREQTGEGQIIECSLFATALNLQGEQVMEHPAADTERNRRRALRLSAQASGEASFETLKGIRAGTDQDPFYRCWLTSDGAIVVAALNPGEKAKALAVFADAAGDGLLSAEKMRTLLARAGSAHWLGLCAEAGIPAAPVLFPVELPGHEQVIANGLMVSLEHETTGPQTAVKPSLTFGDGAQVNFRPAPPLGRHTREVLAGLGYSDQEIEALRALGGVIS